MKPTPIFAPLLLAVSVALPAASVSAEQALAAYDIPAQPLAGALTAFADQANIKLMFESALTRGLRTRGVSGKLSRDAALNQLLEGTGLGYRYTGDETVTLERATVPRLQPNKAEPPALPTVKVTGKVAYDPTDPFNRDYAAAKASSVTKTETPLIETPFSVQVIDKAVVNDQQGVRISDALRNVSGYFNTSSGIHYDHAFLRGFQVGSRMYIDGFRDQAQSRSLANLDRIEVIKGPAAALYGRLAPGGLINHVTKRPLTTPYYSIQQQFGSYDLYRTQVDATGPLTNDGALAYRINMEYLDTNSFVDYLHNQRATVAPSLTWRISDRTQLDLDFRYNETQGAPNFGIPAVAKRPASVPISRYIGEPTDNDDSTLYFGGIGLLHKFSDDWKLEAKFGYNHSEQLFRDTGIDTFDENTGNAEMGYYSSDYREYSYQGLLKLTGKFSWWETHHTLVTGWDYYKRSGSENAYYLAKSMGTMTFPADLNIYRPVYGLPGVNMALETPNSPWFASETWYGFYVQDDMKFLDDWHLLFGTRFDQANSVTSTSPNWVNPIKTNDAEFSPRVGLLYQPVRWLSLYANYVKAFNGANTAKLAPGEKNTPEHSESYEAGIKGEWWDGGLTANLAYYELTKTNIPITHPDPSMASQRYNLLAGEAKSKGVEFDVTGKLTESWSVIGTYTYTDTQFIRANQNIQGHQFAGVPVHAGTLWSRHEFGGLGLPGLWSGAGVFVAGQREGDNANSFQLPGFVRVDAALGYSLNVGPSKVSLQFNVNNLLDKQYYASSGSSGSRTGVLPGSPRTFMGSVRVEF
ncbi:TonB-dependent receptor [Methylococcus sp. EFPC2]|uniref:TonB-dependent siderophore receptor n=1 Tax=Methylococcus sp. EFPC2 TaxID=2812648 RepID=UPI00196818FA|nr:TonB-dependent receptor [Methylococcus sp. EFPC2]QSA96007.1 TonB-dependent receptor [Methylococcus sp. EFPC2]